MKQFDHFLIGFLTGLLTPILGALFYYFFLVNDSSFATFLQGVQDPLVLSPLIRLGATFNLLLFFVFLWSKKDLSARGVVASTFIYGGLVIFLTFI